MRAWVLSGGGSRIIQCQVLIERYMASGGELPDLIVGTSAGGLLAFLISYLGVDGARAELFDIKKRRDIFQGFFFGGPFALGLWHSKPLQKLISRIQYKRLPTYIIDAFVCSYDIERQTKVYSRVSSRPDIVASTACIPILVAPTVNDRYVDGGVVENTPLKFAIDRGATDITVFLCSADEIQKPDRINGKIEMALECLEAQRLEIASDDLKVCSFKNEAGWPKVSATIISPPRNYIGLLNFEHMRQAYHTMHAELRG